MRYRDVSNACRPPSVVGVTDMDSCSSVDGAVLTRPSSRLAIGPFWSAICDILIELALEARKVVLVWRGAEQREAWQRAMMSCVLDDLHATWSSQQQC